MGTSEGLHSAQVKEKEPDTLCRLGLGVMEGAEGLQTLTEGLRAPARLTSIPT